MIEPTLLDRLRGFYNVPVNDGAGLLEGKNVYTRQFEVPPIQLEAANAIECLIKENFRTDKEIIEQTNELARTFYSMLGYTVPTGYKFFEVKHPMEHFCWLAACEAQLVLTKTDVQDIDPYEIEEYKIPG